MFPIPACSPARRKHHKPAHMFSTDPSWGLPWLLSLKSHRYFGELFIIGLKKTDMHHTYFKQLWPASVPIPWQKETYRARLLAAILIRCSPPFPLLQLAVPWLPDHPPFLLRTHRSRLWDWEPGGRVSHVGCLGPPSPSGGQEPFRRVKDAHRWEKTSSNTQIGNNKDIKDSDICFDRCLMFCCEQFLSK